jgi:DNA-binding winged helix-turn-helix (wHTH) protein/Tol biopolymer transport system component
MVTHSRNVPTRLRFGSFEMDCIEGRLYKRGVLLRIENHPLEVLLALLERPGDIVTREELQQRIWRDGTNVSFEDGLNTAVRKLRQALGDSADSPLFIETIPKRGYRFVAPLSSGVGNAAAASSDSSQVHTAEPILPVGYPGRAILQTPKLSFVRAVRENRFHLRATLLVLLIAGVILWQYSREQQLVSSHPAMQATALDGAHSWPAVALSPDGRYVAYTPFDGQVSSLRLRQVANAGDIEILPPSKTFYIGLTFSPDGNDLYVVRSDDATFTNRSLYRMPALGGPAEKLIADVDSPVSFSPDGKQFVFARISRASTLEVRAANSDGSREQSLAQFPGYAVCANAAHATWSPDGRTIAVPYRGIRDGKDRSSLYAVDVSTRRVTEIYSGSGCIGRPQWMPDQSLIFSREGELWSLTNGVAGVRQLVGYTGKLSREIDLSRDGKTAVAVAYHYSDGLWAVQPGLPPKQIISSDLSLLAANELPDGRILITKEDRSIWTTNAEGSDWQRLANIRGVAESCGHFVVVWTEPLHSLVRLNEDGTNTKVLASGAIPPDWTCSPASDSILYVASDAPRTIMRISIDGGEAVPIGRIQGGLLGSSLSISPDGNLLAYAFSEGSQMKKGFAVLRTSDGGLVTAIQREQGGASEIRWTPDAKAIDYTSIDDMKADVWEQSLAGGKPKRITHFGSGAVYSFHWSRNGLMVVWGPLSLDLLHLSGLR